MCVSGSWTRSLWALSSLSRGFFIFHLLTLWRLFRFDTVFLREILWRYKGFLVLSFIWVVLFLGNNWELLRNRQLENIVWSVHFSGNLRLPELLWLTYIVLTYCLNIWIFRDDLFPSFLNLVWIPKSFCLALRFLSPDMTCAWHGAILHSVLVLSVLMLQKKLIVWEDWLITANVAIVKQSSMTLMVCLISYW